MGLHILSRFGPTALGDLEDDGSPEDEGNQQAERAGKDTTADSHEESAVFRNSLVLWLLVDDCQRRTYAPMEPAMADNYICLGFSRRWFMASLIALSSSFSTCSRASLDGLTGLSSWCQN